MRKVDTRHAKWEKRLIDFIDSEKCLHCTHKLAIRETRQSTHTKGSLELHNCSSMRKSVVEWVKDLKRLSDLADVWWLCFYIFNVKWKFYVAARCSQCRLELMLKLMSEGDEEIFPSSRASERSVTLCHLYLIHSHSEFNTVKIRNKITYSVVQGETIPSYLRRQQMCCKRSIFPLLWFFMRFSHQKREEGKSQRWNSPNSFEHQNPEDGRRVWWRVKMIISMSSLFAPVDDVDAV